MSELMTELDASAAEWDATPDYMKPISGIPEFAGRGRPSTCWSVSCGNYGGSTFFCEANHA